MVSESTAAQPRKPDTSDHQSIATQPSVPKQPSSQKPSSQKPSNQKPSSQKPSSQKPSSQKPSSQKPSNQESSSQKPSSQKPSSQKPSSQKPSSQKPSSQKPSSQKPSNQNPSNQKPSNQKPSNQKPSNQKPSNQKPSNQKPSNQKPSNQKPSESPPKRPRPSHPPRPPLSTPLQKRPDAVSRELYLLTGGVTPAPLAPVLQKHTTTKPQRRHHWHFVPFSSSARKDGLTLSHWTKVGSTDSDYAFARFNKPVRIVTYTDAEYTAAVANLLPLADAPSNKKVDDDLPVARSGSLKHGIHRVPPQAPWTKKETDKLFQLCAQFDLRFPVIHDRWPDDLPPRSIDELKDRYYSVAKRLIEWRTQQGVRNAPALALQKHCQAITMNPFDYEYECVRKNQLEWHYHRSKAELREEEETVREARRIEQNRRRLQKERQRLAKLLTPARELASGSGSAENLTPSLMPQKTFPHRKPTTGAYARSSMIYAPVSQSSRISKRVDSALLELNVGLRPTPTAIVVDNFDLLRIEILSYIELQRTVCRKEEDTHLLRVKLAKLKGEPVPAPPPGITLSHKKRRAEDVEIGSLFGPSVKQQKS